MRPQDYVRCVLQLEIQASVRESVAQHEVTDKTACDVTANVKVSDVCLLGSDSISFVLSHGVVIRKASLSSGDPDSSFSVQDQLGFPGNVRRKPFGVRDAFPSRTNTIGSGAAKGHSVIQGLGHH